RRVDFDHEMASAGEMMLFVGKARRQKQERRGSAPGDTAGAERFLIFTLQDEAKVRQLVLMLRQPLIRLIGRLGEAEGLRPKSPPRFPVEMTPRLAFDLHAQHHPAGAGSPEESTRLGARVLRRRIQIKRTAVLCRTKRLPYKGRRRLPHRLAAKQEVIRLL